jgi:hypothetical protein
LYLAVVVGQFPYCLVVFVGFVFFIADLVHVFLPKVFNSYKSVVLSVFVLVVRSELMCA